jgi:hypothetical protein
MSLYKKDEFLNAISMIPGFALIGWWMTIVSFDMWPPLIGYVLMCCGSIYYHTDAMLREKNSKLLRLDLVCQNIACITGILYSPYSDNNFLLMIIINCAYIACVKTDLRNIWERYLAKFCNGISIFIMISFDNVLIIEFCGSACIFLYYYLYHVNDYSHAIWHLTIHGIINRYIHLLVDWNLKKNDL